MQGRAIRHTGCFPFFKSLQVSSLKTVYFSNELNKIDSIWTQDLFYTKDDFHKTFEALATLLSQWPAADSRHVSGIKFNCACLQGKTIRIGCWNFTHGFCIQKHTFTPFHRIAKWKVSNKKEVNINK